MRKKYYLLLTGVVLGIVYGLITRVVFGEKATLASVTFLFVIPTILGLFSLAFADEEQLKSYKNIIFIPWLTVASFFLTMFVMGLEEFICLLILAGPFFILGTLGAFIIRFMFLRKENRKKQLLTLVLLPFLLSPAEESVKSPSVVYKVEKEIIISASPTSVWNYIVEVKPIQAAEYKAGIFNKLGIPRPLQAEVDRTEVGGQRIGSFEGGLRFVEHITYLENNREISFVIQVDPSSVRNNVFDQHVLNGNYFSFVSAQYQLIPVSQNQTKLKLTSSYQLTSKINFYGKFWGNVILGDFQQRLLEVIKKRCEKISK